MRTFKPIHPPRDFDPRLYEILATLNAGMMQFQSGIAKLDRGTTTDGSSSQIGATDHGELDGLADDDHVQYLLLAGRSGGQSILGDSATSGTSTTPTLTLANYNLNSISGAQRITLIGGGAGSGSILVETNQFKVVERTKTTGFTLFTGSNFVNGENTGSFSFFGESTAAEPVVFISTTGNAALGDRNLVLRKRSSQTGHMLQLEDSAGGNLSHFRASDGAFVGPWAPAAAAYALLNTSIFTDVTAGAASRGGLIVGDSTGKWGALAIGATGKVLTSDGTDATWQTPAAGGGSAGFLAVTKWGTD